MQSVGTGPGEEAIKEEGGFPVRILRLGAQLVSIWWY